MGRIAPFSGVTRGCDGPGRRPPVPDPALSSGPTSTVS